MRNRWLVHLIVQLLVLVFVCSTATFVGLISFGAIGGTAMGVAPQLTFGLVEPLICPENTHLEYSSVQRSYHRPGESEPHVECVAEDGTRVDALVSGIFTVLGLTFSATFLVAFVVLGLPLAIAAFLIVRLILRRRAESG